MSNSHIPLPGLGALPSDTIQVTAPSMPVLPMPLDGESQLEVPNPSEAQSQQEASREPAAEAPLSNSLNSVVVEEPPPPPAASSNTTVVEEPPPPPAASSNTTVVEEPPPAPAASSNTTVAEEPPPPASSSNNTAANPEPDALSSTNSTQSVAVASSNLYLKLIRHEGVKYVVNFKLKDSNLLSHCLVEADFPLAPAMLVFQGQCSDGSSVDMAGVAAFEILASRNEWKTFQRLEIPYKSEQKEYTFDFVPFYAYAFNISGSLKERSASIHLDVSTKHRLKEGAIYVLALIPVDKTVVVYALNSQNSWTQVKDADAVPARFKGKLPNTLDAKILDKSDITALVGTKVVVGYGLGSSSFKEMIDTKRSLLVYTLAP